MCCVGRRAVVVEKRPLLSGMISHAYQCARGGGLEWEKNRFCEQVREGKEAPSCCLWAKCHRRTSDRPHVYGPKQLQVSLGCIMTKVATCVKSIRRNK